ncbi:MAG: hypothetical protein ABSA26_03455 [Thermoguttaceae bacterium]|jgi:hypothetical protein
MHEEKQSAEMKQFEAALAALTPRTDRLDRERLMFLAGQQSILPSSFGRGQQSVLPSTDQPTMPTNAAHRCPMVPVGARRVAGGEGKKRIGAWPAAFATMTVVAAALLAMLIVRPATKDAENVVIYPASQSAPATDAKETTLSNDYAEQPRNNRTYFDLAFLSGTDNRKISEAESPHSNAALLRQILAKGVDSWKPSETGAIGGKPIIARPITNRELLDQLLNQPGAGPS